MSKRNGKMKYLAIGAIGLIAAGGLAAQNPKTQVLYSRVPSLCGLAALALWPHLEYPH